jgi:hypothetical protein
LLAGYLGLAYDPGGGGAYASPQATLAPQIWPPQPTDTLGQGGYSPQLAYDNYTQTSQLGSASSQLVQQPRIEVAVPDYASHHPEDTVRGISAQLWSSSSPYLFPFFRPGDIWLGHLSLEDFIERINNKRDLEDSSFEEYTGEYTDVVGFNAHCRNAYFHYYFNRLAEQHPTPSLFPPRDASSGHGTTDGQLVITSPRSLPEQGLHSPSTTNAAQSHPTDSQRLVNSADPARFSLCLRCEGPISSLYVRPRTNKGEPDLVHI